MSLPLRATPRLALRRTVLFALAGGMLCGAGIAGCNTPDPPTIKSESVTVTSATPAGLGLSISLLVTNPNGIGLTARKLDGKVTLEGGTELGTISVPTTVSLPAKATTRLVVPMTVGWGNAMAVALIAASKPVVPFTVAGKANLGGKSLNVDVPFSVSGTLTREQLLQAGTGALPKLF